jgi:glutaconate CoA-transferase subunit A
LKTVLDRVEISVDEAVGTIEDGAVIGIGGALTAGHPMALVRGLARRRVRNLTIVAPTAGLEIDVLIGTGCVRRVVTSYIGGETVVGVGPVFRRAVEAGEVEVVDLDEGQCAMGLRAAAQQLPYLPWRAGVGTSFPKLNHSLVEYNDPVNGEPLIAVPAIHLDVALLYAEAADRLGNGQTTGTGYMDPLIGGAAHRVLLQADRLIDREELRLHPERTTYWNNADVVRCPFGTHPYSCGWLLADENHLQVFADAARAGGADLDAYITRYVDEPQSHDFYLDEIGASRLAGLMF